MAAVITVVLLRPLYVWLDNRRRLHGRTGLVTTITILLFIFVLVVPLTVITVTFFNQVIEIVDEVSSTEVETSMADLAAAVEDALQQIPPLSDIEISEDDLAQAIQSVAKAALSWLSGVAASLLSSLPNLFVGGIIYLIVLASLLPAFDELGKRVQEISPLDMNVSQLYLHRANVMVTSVLKGVFFLAILQGLIMGVFYSLAGIPFSSFWMLLSMAFAILPVVGISFIVWPLTIIALLTGNPQAAVLMLFGFYVVVNPLDIILRPRLVSKEAYLNFTLMLLALFGGIQLAGLLGMIFGPVIMILLLTSIDIYTQFYSGRAPKETTDVERIDAGSTAVDLIAGQSQEEE
jgi:predicted PurR-regulated permease PerM